MLWMRSEFNRYMPAIHCEVWMLMSILSATFYGIASIDWQLKLEFHQHLHSTLSVFSQVFPHSYPVPLFLLLKQVCLKKGLERDLLSHC